MNRKAESEFRSRICLNGTWDFLPCGKAGKWLNTPENTSSEPWTIIDVPAFYRSDGGMRFGGKSLYTLGYSRERSTNFFPELKKYCWYKRSFDFDEKTQGKRIVLDFRGVSAKAEVWLNEELIGSHAGAFNPFSFDVTQQVKAGENILYVKVTGMDAFKKHRKVTGECGSFCEIAPGEGNSSGIYQDVFLNTIPFLHINSVHIFPELDSLKAKVFPGGCSEFPANSEIKLSIKDYSGNIIAEKISPAKRDIEINGLDCENWTPKNPVLYHVEFELFIDGKKCDLYSERTGFRTFTIDGSRFLLNGKPYFLMGGDGPAQGYVRRDKDYIYKFVRMMKELNIEFTRFHTLPASPQWLDACDELGVLVVQESPVMQTTIPPDTFKKELRAMLNNDINHPSIIVWSLGNECSFPATSGHLPSFKEYIKEMEQTVKLIDPFRPVINDNHAPVKEAGGDIDSIHNYCGWYANIRKSLFGKVSGADSSSWVKYFDGKPEFYSDFAAQYQYSSENPPMIYNEFIAAYISNRNVFLQKNVRRRRIGRIGEKQLPQACSDFMCNLSEFMIENLRLMRGPESNISGIMPFALMNWFHNLGCPETIYPKPIARAIGHVLNPILAVIELKQKNNFAGKDIDVLCYVINDSRLIDRISVSNFEIFVEDKYANIIYKSEAGFGDVEYFEKECRQIKIPALKTTENVSELTIYAKCSYMEDGQSNTFQTARKRLNIAQVKTPTKTDSVLNLAGNDPELEALLLKYGISFRKVDKAKMLKQESPLLVGRNGVDFIEKNAKLLNSWLANGGRMLVMEQDPPGGKVVDLFALTGCQLCLKYEVSDNNVKLCDMDDFVWLNKPNHKIFEGLSSEIMREPNGDGVLIKAYLQQSDGVNYDTYLYGKPSFKIKHSTKVKHLATAYFDLRDEAVAEISVGNGSILMSQLEVIRRYDVDPIARTYIINLLNWLQK